MSSDSFHDCVTDLDSPLAALGDTSPPRNPRQDGYGYNPRCIKRDISGYLVQRDSTPAKTAALITNSKTIGSFQDTMQAANGVHSSGHFTVSGDPGSGKFTRTHSMRVYTD
jgi:tyrosinase